MQIVFHCVVFPDYVSTEATREWQAMFGKVTLNKHSSLP